MESPSKLRSETEPRKEKERSELWESPSEGEEGCWHELANKFKVVWGLKGWAKGDKRDDKVKDKPLSPWPSIFVSEAENKTNPVDHTQKSNITTDLNSSSIKENLSKLVLYSNKQV